MSTLSDNLKLSSERLRPHHCAQLGEGIRLLGPIRLQISFLMPCTNSQQVHFEHHSMFMHMEVLVGIDGCCSSILCLHCNTFKQQTAVYAVYTCGLLCKHTSSTCSKISKFPNQKLKTILSPSQIHPPAYCLRLCWEVSE